MTRKRPVFNSPPAAPQSGSWYRIGNAANLAANEPLPIDLMDEIGGWGIMASDFIRELRAADDGQRPVHVHIASLGGDVWQGIAISNALRNLGERCTVRIESIAASIASVIAVGAHRVEMPENAMMMIHNPWTWAAGDAAELRDAADLLDKVKGTLIACYQAKAPGLSDGELTELLDKETWLTAAEAKAMGLVDEVLPLRPIQANAAMSERMRRFRNAPASLLAELDPPAPPPPAPPPVGEPPQPDPAAALALAQLAASLCAEHQLPLQAMATVLASSSLRDDASVRAAVNNAIQIRDLCVVAKLPELTGSLLASGLDVESARARLFDKMVAAAGDDLDNTPPATDPPPAARKPLSHAAIYAARNKRSRGTTK